MLSANFSHQFLDGQNSRTELPSWIVSKHRLTIWSSSPYDRKNCVLKIWNKTVNENMQHRICCYSNCVCVSVPSHLHLQSGFEIPDQIQWTIIYLIANLQLFHQRYRSIISVIQIGIQPTGQQVQIRQSGAHPHNLDPFTELWSILWRAPNPRQKN